MVLDTAPRVLGAPTSRFDGVTHFFPEATDGRTCLAVLMIRQLSGYGRAWWWFRPPRRHPEDVVGPCAYYAAFGEPGGQIKRWLESRHYSPAAYPGWAFSQDHGRVVLFDADSEFLYLTSLLYFSPGFVVCAAGHREPCRDALLWQAEGPGAEPAPPGIFEVGVRDPDDPLAGTDAYLLSDVLLDMGRERFARFWASELSVEEAFAAAMGVPLEEWVMRWARSHVDPQAFDRGAPTSSCLLALLVAGACLAAGVWWGARRQVA